MTLQAPQVVSATLDMYGCNAIEVVFDRPISKAADHLCSNYFDAATVSALSLQGKTSYIKFKHAFKTHTHARARTQFGNANCFC